MSETYQVCGCGVWTLTPGQETHNEPRKYGVVTHRRGQPCIATPNKSPDSEMVEWTWRTRAEAAEAEVDELTAERDALRAQVQRVRDLHVPSQTVKSRISGLPVCCRCHDIYPCETLRALDGGDDE
jgi:hypothetical protein